MVHLTAFQNETILFVGVDDGLDDGEGLFYGDVDGARLGDGLVTAPHSARTKE